ncbi:hypothetical protein ZWY2020_031486 [Hordeum vulgare]|nr:hypothetical protein ZWY2020_031486 [Hordeum vulgare]
MARTTPPPAGRRSATPPPRSRRPAAPAKRGTAAFGIPNAVAAMLPSRRVVLEMQDEGEKRQVPVKLPATGISAPPNPFGVLASDVSGDDDPKA